jgi:uncharacterized LabA/DUF88 family protein
MKQRAFVFIDGSNFYHKLKDLCVNFDSKRKFLNFKYLEFINWLIGENQFVGARYYIGAIKRVNNDVKSQNLYSDQQKLLSKLDILGIKAVLGNVIKHPDKTFHEKGVDVRLAVEMIRLARKDEYDVAYLLSSDTDLVAAVEEVQSFGKIVIYVGISKGQSFGLTKVADDVILLRSSDIDIFLPKIL